MPRPVVCGQSVSGLTITCEGSSLAVTLEEARAPLEPEEPDYEQAARNLGPNALLHLDRLLAGDHPMLASKAANLAGLRSSGPPRPLVLRHTSVAHLAFASRATR